MLRLNHDERRATALKLPHGVAETLMCSCEQSAALCVAQASAKTAALTRRNMPIIATTAADKMGS